MTRPARLSLLPAALVFLLALGVYATCVTPTVPFWDSGEFIASAATLGIPHPPGTPLYVLIARLATLLPLGPVAVRVNLLSGLATALAALFTYLVAARLTRRVLGADTPEWVTWAAGGVAALFTAFAPTIWDNAVEAEVYGAAQAILMGCLWLAFRYWDAADREAAAGGPATRGGGKAAATPAGPAATASAADAAAGVPPTRILLLILYVLFLAIGIHLGTFLVFPCIYLLVTMLRWGQVRRGGFWGSVGLFAVALVARFGVLQSGAAEAGQTDLIFMTDSTRQMASLLSLVMGAALAWNVLSVLGPRTTLAIGALAVLGVSVHLYLLIRAGLHPPLNEADPSTLHNLWLVLTRDQYKPPEPIFRKAPFGYQFGHMYLRYLREQFTLFGAAAGFTWLLPAALGAGGAVAAFRRERRAFYLLLALTAITGPFLVWYLNFSDHEVRERDYFFAAHVNVLALWVGLGVAWLADTARRASTAAAGAAVAVAGLGVSLLPLLAGADNQNFHRHDRRGNYLAHDYGYNMLVGLRPDAILFTNGDNDTFPLWYLQQVEKFRPDVRVINLSLLQTDWYARQLRDLPPKVPLNLTNAQISAVAPRREKNRVVSEKEILVRAILEANQWMRPVYLAVTVPDQMGLSEQLQMEGLTFRIHPRAVKSNVNAEVGYDNLVHKYLYRGFMNADGTPDTRVYKDEQARRLLQNYTAVGVRVVMGMNELGRREEALGLMRWVQAAAPDTRPIQMAIGLSWERLAAWDVARAHYEKLLTQYPGDPEVLAQVGHTLAAAGDSTAAVGWLEKGRAAGPGRFFNTYAELATIYQGQKKSDAAVAVLTEWLRYNAGDPRGQELLARLAPPAPSPGH